MRKNLTLNNDLNETTTTEIEKEKGQLISQVEQLKKSNNILTSSKEKDDKIIKDLTNSLKIKEKELSEKNMKIS